VVVIANLAGMEPETSKMKTYNRFAPPMFHGSISSVVPVFIGLFFSSILED
jgi:hypothetical protein